MYWTMDDVELKFFNKESGETIQQGVIIPKKKEKDIIDMEEVLSGYSVVELENEVKKYPVESYPEEVEVESNSIIRVQYEKRREGELLEYNKANIHKVNLNTSNPMLPGMKSAFLSMRKREVAWFLIEGCHYKIRMVDVQAQVAFDNKTAEGKLQQVEKYRVSGQQDFQRRDYKAARNKFIKAINSLKNWPKNVDVDQKRVKELLILFQGNLSQALIELKQYDDAILVLSDIKDAMRDSRYEVKNYYRLAKCYFLTSDKDRAIRTIKECKMLCDLDSDEQDTYQLLEARIRKQLKH